MLQKAILYLLCISFLIACSSNEQKANNITQARENKALEDLIESGDVHLFELSIPNIEDTIFYPVSGKYKSELSVYKESYYKELSKYIDTTKLIDYAASLKQTDIDSSFKHYRNVKLFAPGKNKHYLVFSKPLFFGNSYCYVELDYDGMAGAGYFFLLAFTDNKWRVIMKRETWIS